MNLKDLKKFNLSDKPGVYFFLGPSKRSAKKDRKPEILYIGKATSLKDRVKSYFSKDLVHTRGPLIADMVWRTDKVKFIETDSVLEALILEANLIKKHQPYYNSREKDDKSFLSVVIMDEELPKVLTVRTHNLKKQHSNILKNVRISKVYGPFTNGMQLREALKIIRKIFPFYDDKTKNYKEFYKQIKLAPNTEERKKYMRNIRNIKLFFAGKKGTILKDLEREMKRLAKEEKFELANEIKKQIFALKHINDISLIKKDYSSVLQKTAIAFRIEAYDIAHMSGKNMVGVMVVVADGQVDKNEYRKFKIKLQDAPARTAKRGGDDTGALTEVLERRLGHNEWQYPNLIVVDGSTAQINTAKKVLREVGVKIPVVSVVKDEKHKPKGIKGLKKFTSKYEAEILLANSEAHRFAIRYHKDMRNNNFLPSSPRLRRTRK